MAAGQQNTLNPYAKIDRIIAEEKRRGLRDAWRQKDDIIADILLVATVTERVKSYMSTLAEQCAAASAADVRLVFFREQQFAAGGGRVLPPDDPNWWKFSDTLRVAEYEINALFRELMVLSHQGRFDFLQCFVAEIWEAIDIREPDLNQNRNLGTDQAKALYRREIGPDRQFLMLTSRRSPRHLPLDTIPAAQDVSCVALPRLLPGLMKLESLLRAQVKHVDAARNKVMAAGVSVGIAVSQIAATHVYRTIYPNF